MSGEEPKAEQNQEEKKSELFVDRLKNLPDVESFNKLVEIEKDKLISYFEEKGYPVEFSVLLCSSIMNLNALQDMRSYMEQSEEEEEEND